MAKTVLEHLSTESRIKERVKGFVVLSMDFKNKLKQYLTSASRGVLLLQFSYFFLCKMRHISQLNMIPVCPQMSPSLRGAAFRYGTFTFIHSFVGFFVHATTGLQNDKSPTLLCRGWTGLFAEATAICQAIVVLHDSL